MAKKTGTFPVLFSLRQVATFSGRAYETVKFYYNIGVLPDPADTKHWTHKTIRKFTQEEMENIRNILQNIGYGDIADKTRAKRERYPKKDKETDSVNFAN